MSTSPHLQALEAESIFLIREVAAERERPLLLHSMGKDSAVLWHLARKAFWPEAVPFPVLHIDTTWKFTDMIAYRERHLRASGARVMVHTNHAALAEGLSPLDPDPSRYTDRVKTQALREALTSYRCDAAFGGARRDEEKSRAKERMVSVRDRTHRWHPERQRPEFWRIVNAEVAPGESLRVFPLSNWTERDVWEYIAAESIDVVSLYFARVRPVVRRNGLLIVMDDDRFVVRPGETVQPMRVRFRTLGCYPLTGAIESEADSVPAILDELGRSTLSERQGRAIDHEATASMERRKRDGYF